MSTSAASAPGATSVTGALGESNGKAQTSEGMSLETFLSSLAVAAAVFGAEVLLFVLLRTKLQRVYEPRTYLVPEKCVLSRIPCILTSLTVLSTDAEQNHRVLDF